MFASSSKYNAVRAELLLANAKFNALLNQWNALVDRINSKGGEAFLKRGNAGSAAFNQEEINVLIKLCHPDKHGGSDQATEITKKLLQLRKKP